MASCSMLIMPIAFTEDSSSAAILVGMAGEKDVGTVGQENSSQEPPQQRKPWTLKEYGGKTVWDWLQLIGVLAIPVVLAIGGCTYNEQQNARQQAFERQLVDAELELEDRRAQDAALQAYLDQMSTLLVEKDLRDAEANSELRTLARARTLSLLDMLDADRKREVVRFLVEAKLLQRVDEGPSVIGLGGADLSGANLGGLVLQGAQLRHANLREANLIGTDLSNTDLSDANLEGAHGITNEELEQQALSLEGATMRNGQKYEDWLKSRGEGAE